MYLTEREKKGVCCVPQALDRYEMILYYKEANLWVPYNSAYQHSFPYSPLSRARCLRGKTGAENINNTQFVLL